MVPTGPMEGGSAASGALVRAETKQREREQTAESDRRARYSFLGYLIQQAKRNTLHWRSPGTRRLGFPTSGIPTLLQRPPTAALRPEPLSLRHWTVASHSAPRLRGDSLGEGRNRQAQANRQHCVFILFHQPSEPRAATRPTTPDTWANAPLEAPRLLLS